MKILLLAPHPFYQERGTPIAVRRLVECLSQRGDDVDVLTYGEGEDVELARVTIRRVAGFIRGVPPGFSMRKVISDVVMTGIAARMVSSKQYDVIHAVEESAFIAVLLQAVYGVPYVYDMDSSLAQQMADEVPALKIVLPLMRKMEGVAVRKSTAVVAVCSALVDTARSYDETKPICLLPDTVYEEASDTSSTADDLRQITGISGPVLLYVGNLAPYQGIDLALEGFNLYRRKGALRDAHLVIIGGSKKDIMSYRNKCKMLGLLDAVHFLGPRPLSDLSAYLSQADILLSPRIRGNNTPMKIFAYLHSGKPVLATDIESHTQVLDSSVALLSQPDPSHFADAIEALLESSRLRESLGLAGRELVRRKYGAQAYEKNLHSFYGRVEAMVSTNDRALSSGD